MAHDPPHKRATARENDMKSSSWTPATIPDESIASRDAARKERKDGTTPIDFTLTPAERDIAKLAMVEIIAAQRSGRANFGSSAPGLESGFVSVVELTPEERKFFGLGDDA